MNVTDEMVRRFIDAANPLVNDLPPPGVIREAIAAVLALLPSAADQPVAAIVWHEGAPTGPWATEWFMAVTTHGDRVVLRALPEEYSYDFTTADQTYLKRETIKRWAQFPDREFIDYPRPASARPSAGVGDDDASQDVAVWTLLGLAETCGAKRDEDDNSMWWTLDLKAFYRLEEELRARNIEAGWPRPAVAPAAEGWGAADACEEFIAAEIDSAPEALRRLGEYLCRVLDDDHYKTADRMLLGVATEMSAAIRAATSEERSSNG